MTAAKIFRIDEPMGSGTTVLEASAGTGKTYAIVALAVRRIAEGTPISELLMATFSRASTAELRDRMRSRIRQAVGVLAEPAQAPGSDDPLLRVLLTGTDEEIDLRRQRLLAALSDFDAATVATTHTFCNRMLAALGFLGNREQEYPLVENVDDLVAEVTADLYLARFARDAAGVDDLPFEVAGEVARKAVRDGAARLEPTDGNQPDSVQQRVRLAAAVRRHTGDRKRRARLRTYDDLQEALYRIVTDPEIGEAACERIRERFAVVLIDEFQDTDPQQWEIVRRCFDGHRPLILVGDPKQAIYGFRGAEVLSYLDAVAGSSDVHFLGVNHRSYADVVDGLGQIFTNAAFGHPQIAFHPVSAARSGSGLAEGAAVRIRAFTRADFDVLDKSGRVPRLPGVREQVIADVADDVVATLAHRKLRTETGDLRAAGPGDIAILLRSGWTIEPIQEALRARGVPSVVTSGTSVFATDAARYWWYVLAAVEKPSHTARVRLAALTPLIGRSAADLDAGGDTAIGELAGELAELGRVFSEGGFAAMTSRLFAGFGVAERVLAGDGGERLLTDLQQLSEICNRHVSDTGCGIATLGAWLAEHIADRSRHHPDEATRRLDRDTQAVQIMTVHAAKGLEFAIVYVPFGWATVGGFKQPETFVLHDDDHTRLLDVGGKRAAGHHGRRQRSRRENDGEELRLLYVALTRATSEVVMWWAPSTVTDRSPMHRLLFTVADRHLATGPVALPEQVPIPEEPADCVAALRGVAALHAAISVERAGKHPAGRMPPPQPTPELLGEPRVAVFDREIDLGWRRNSYSSIVRDAHAAAVALPAGDGEAGALTDEPVLPEDPAAVTAAPSPETMPSPMNGLPFGAGFGTLVHDVLENVDTTAADMAGHVRDLCLAGAARRGDDLDVERLAAALVGVLTTPLGFGDLWSIHPRDRLSELDFELPLSDRAGGFRLASVAALLKRHLPHDDPLREYAEVLPSVSEQRFHGYLTGSIDSVLRVSDPRSAGDRRYVVVDYKTNRIRPGELAVTDFDQAAMAGEMMAAHYPLQALLYSVAVHRFLRWRLLDYRPQDHLGPVQYHFVRGMAGPDTPAGCGVFEWRLPPQLVIDLSDLLAGRPEGEPT